MPRVDTIRELELDNQELRNDIIDLQVANDHLRSENTSLERELQFYCDNFNSDEDVIEKIHWLYYEICDRVDEANPIDIELLNAFFRLTIDKKV